MLRSCSTSLTFGDAAVENEPLLQTTLKHSACAIPGHVSTLTYSLAPNAMPRTYDDNKKSNDTMKGM
eukprot:4147599-Amphidinium_carterae.2